VRRFLLLLAILALTISSCARTDKKLSGTGSTFIAPLMTEWSGKYSATKGVSVNYESVGSSAGFQRWSSGIFDFACSDAPLSDQQLEKAKAVGGDVVHIPLVMGAVVPVYNLGDKTEELTFSGEVLANIFLGKIKKWNDEALVKLNPGAQLPGEDIQVIHRLEGSGTTYILTDYFCKVSEEWKKTVGAGTTVEWPTGTAKSGNEGVGGMVKKTPYSIGYIALGHALKHDIRFGSVKNREDVPVKATLEAVKAATTTALTDLPADLRFSITNAKGKDSYPICGTTWAILFTKQAPDKRTELVDFLRWATHDGQDFVEGLNYVRLPKAVVEQIDKVLDRVKAGN
jgi:phosphate transport system substrate-binding protein